MKLTRGRLPEKARERERLWAKGINFDIVGFLLIATFLGGLEVVLDRGQIDDWFNSSFIVTFAAISAIALLLFIQTQHYILITTTAEIGAIIHKLRVRLLD